MKFGVLCYNSDDGADPIAVGRRAEELGFESIFVPDHSHIPVKRVSPFPMPPWEMPRQYYRMRDPFITLAGIATVTSRIGVGTGICLAVERDPISLAKVTASLDYASDGRFIFGVGTGWNLEEMANHGTDPSIRTALLRERVMAIKEIWTKDEAEFHGRFVSFDPIFSWPKPKQIPHPPVLVGGGGPSVLARVVEYGDGWFPGHQKDLDELGARIAELQTLAADAGRIPIPVSIMFGLPKFIAKYEDMDVDRVVFGISPGPIETVYRELDALAAAARLP